MRLYGESPSELKPCILSDVPNPEPLTLCAGVGSVDGVAADEKAPLLWALALLVLAVTTDTDDVPENGSDMFGET